MSNGVVLEKDLAEYVDNRVDKRFDKRMDEKFPLFKDELGRVDMYVLVENTKKKVDEIDEKVDRIEVLEKKVDRILGHLGLKDSDTSS